MRRFAIMMFAAAAAGSLAAQTSAPSIAPATLAAASSSTAPSAPAASSQPASASAPVSARAAPDLLKGCIDPYDQPGERMRFLRAAGVDSELDQKEAQADQARDGGFVRSFEKWDAMIAFDKNGNGALDWTEAEAYREDLRKHLLATFDANQDGRLTGAERDAANRALLGGRITRPSYATSMPTWRDLANMSPEERRAAIEQMRQAARQRMLERYDTDGDGELSDAERAEMRRDMRRNDPMAQLFQQIRIQQFDDDNDGELSEQEQEQAKAFEKRLQQTGEQWRTRLMDADGDGKVSDEEAAAFRTGMVVAGLGLMQKFQAVADLDGDGQVSPEERQLFGERLRDGMQTYMQKLLYKYDSTGTGRLSPEDREDLLEGIQADFDGRLERAVGPDGKVGPEAAVKLTVDFLKDLGVDLNAGTAASQPAGAQQPPQ